MKMSSKFTCRFCKEQFDQPKGLYKHLQTAHSAGASEDNRTCPICGVLCSKYEGYRDHLLYIHGQNNEGQQLSFKTLNEFLLWKTELELKYHCKYVMQNSPKILTTKEKKYFYQCDGSGSKAKDKKTVVMKSCSSVISVVEGTSVFKVEYWDTHSNHSKSAEMSVQNELNAAISSVEMVNAIADSDDSLEKLEGYIIDTGSSSISQNKKQSSVKSHLKPSVKSNNSPVTSLLPKTTSEQSKPDVAKKKANTSMLFSLASVACGKGITKKSANKLSANKKEYQSGTNSLKDTETKKENGEAIGVTLKEHDSTTVAPVSKTSLPAKSNTKSASTVSKSAASKTSLSTTKSTPSGPLAIAPKPASMTNSSISSLFAGNSVFPNQLVIVNPVGMDQNSSQNVITAGQNIVLSLPLGQNILSANATAPQSGNQTPAPKESSTKSSENAVTKEESSKVKTSTKSTAVKSLQGVSKSPSATKTTTAKTLLDSSKSLSDSKTGIKTSTTSSSSPITLPNSPVLLSSLPVGSTFVSVNNNLIPIATPSGTFLPSSLPPNIVLTPVPSTTMSNTHSGPKTSVNSSTGTTTSSIVLPTSLPPNIVLTPVISSAAANSQSAPKLTFSSIGSSPGTLLPTSLPPNVVLTPVLQSTQTATKTTNSHAGSSGSKVTQNQLLFSVPSTPVTVSSIVREQTNNVFSSSAASSVSSSRAPSTSTPKKFKSNFTPNSITSPISARKSVQTPTIATRTVTSLENSDLFSKLGTDVTVQKVNNTTSTTKSTVTSSSPATKKARKSVSKSLTSIASSNSIPLSSSTKTVSALPATISTNVVNSNLNLTPISSTPDVTMMHQPVNSGTLIFESSGEIFMLEPIENNAVKSLSPLKGKLEAPKIKVDISVQTVEDLDDDIFSPKCNRKRPAPNSGDDAVMMKVKCYQLEMQYLQSQAECKQLKLELTKERLKNAELTGEKVPTNSGDEEPGESRNKAREIMKEIEDRFNENKDTDVYTLTKTSVLRSLYDDIEQLCLENSDLHKELENYRAHDRFYQSLQKRIFDEDF